MTRIVADLGNSRMKWGRVDLDGRLGATVALPTDDPATWSFAWDAWDLSESGSSWSIASVNPPLADRLGRFLKGQGVTDLRWYRSAGEVAVRHDLEHPESAGTDRALAVVGALAAQGGKGPGLVVSCGTAITVERISLAGVWQGGAIAPGLKPMAKALHLTTAQLPEVEPGDAPSPFGRSTVPAMEAGLFWGVVGAIRELLHRQAEGLTPAPWLLWTGGDASLFAQHIEWSNAEVRSNLVLEGLARGFGTRDPRSSPVERSS